MNNNYTNKDNMYLQQEKHERLPNKHKQYC